MLHVDDGGAGGMPVVFIHSFAGSSAHWSAQLAHLRQNRRAVALDLRGHGKSALPRDGDYAIVSLVSDVAAVVDRLRLKRFVLVGHSLGGAVAIAYSDARPDRVVGLVLVGAPGKVPAEQAQQIITAIETDYDKVMRQYWDKLLAGAKRDVRAQIEREMLDMPKDQSLRLIRVDVRVRSSSRVAELSRAEAHPVHGERRHAERSAESDARCPAPALRRHQPLDPDGRAGRVQSGARRISRERSIAMRARFVR